jgi:DNA-binding NarL/FixJ family response regulator
MQADWPIYIQTCARLGWVWANPATVASVLRESATQEDHMRQYAALAAQPDDEMLKKLQVPALVMATREEARPFGREEDAKRIAAVIPQARLVIFDDIRGGFSSPEGGTPPLVLATQHALRERPDHIGQTKLSQVPAGLSSRELEVLRLVAAGKSNQQIAGALVISPSTVLHHVTNILTKTGCSNRTEAAIYARDRGIA